MNNISIEKKLQIQKVPLHLVLDSGSVESNRVEGYDEELVRKPDLRAKSMSMHENQVAFYQRKQTLKRKPSF